MAALETFLNEFVRKGKVLSEVVIKLYFRKLIRKHFIGYMIHGVFAYTDLFFNSFRYHEVQCSLQLPTEVSRAIVRVARCGLVPSQTS